MAPSDKYCTYLLRLWRAADGEWRAALVDPQSGARQTFATLALCCEHLRRLAQAGQLSGGAACQAPPEVDDLD